jgi:multisubunit Na+/H+ antiporter MnhB subunit
VGINFSLMLKMARIIGGRGTWAQLVIGVLLAVVGLFALAHSIDWWFGWAFVAIGGLQVTSVIVVRYMGRRF